MLSLASGPCVAAFALAERSCLWPWRARAAPLLVTGGGGHIAPPLFARSSADRDSPLAASWSWPGRPLLLFLLLMLAFGPVAARFCFRRPLRSRFAAGRFLVVAVARAALPFSCFCPCGRFCFRRPALAVAVVASATTRAAALARAANALLCSCAIDAPFNVGGTTVREVIREPGKQAPRILDPATAPSRAG